MKLISVSRKITKVRRQDDTVFINTHWPQLGVKDKSGSRIQLVRFHSSKKKCNDYYTKPNQRNRLKDKAGVSGKTSRFTGPGSPLPVSVSPSSSSPTSDPNIAWRRDKATRSILLRISQMLSNVKEIQHTYGITCYLAQKKIPHRAM